MMNKRNIGPNTKLGDPPKYTVVLNHILGRGGFSTVHIGYNIETQDHYAVKVIDLARMKKTSKLYNCILQEIAILRDVQNNNIIRLYDTYEQDNKLYLVLELCDMDFHSYFQKKRLTAVNKPYSLQTGLRSGPRAPFFEEKEIKYWIRQIRSAMKVLNENEYVHRDMKPENFLLKRKQLSIQGMNNDRYHYENYILKICDLGFSKKLSIVDLTTTTCGTIPYMAPEQIDQKPYSYKIDLWSLGLIVLEMVRGKRAFESPKRKKRKQVAKNNQSAPRKERMDNMKRQLKIFNVEKYLKQYILSEDAKSLLRGLLEPNDQKRISFQQFANHAFMSLEIDRTIYSIDDVLFNDGEEEEGEEEDDDDGILNYTNYHNSENTYSSEMSQFSPDQEIKTQFFSSYSTIEPKEKKTDPFEEEETSSETKSEEIMKNAKNFDLDCITPYSEEEEEHKKILGLLDSEDIHIFDHDLSDLKSAHSEPTEEEKKKKEERKKKLEVKKKKLEISVSPLPYNSPSISFVPIKLTAKYNNPLYRGNRKKRLNEGELLSKSIQFSEAFFQSKEKGIVLFTHRGQLKFNSKNTQLSYQIEEPGEYSLTITNLDVSFLGVINKFYVQVSVQMQNQKTRIKSDLSPLSPMVIPTSSQSSKTPSLRDDRKKERLDNFVKIEMISKPEKIKHDHFVLVGNKKAEFRIRLFGIENDDEEESSEEKFRQNMDRLLQDSSSVIVDNRKTKKCSLFIRLLPRSQGFRSRMGTMMNLRVDHTKFLCVLRRCRVYRND